jgi:hypothetical protein
MCAEQDEYILDWRADHKPPTCNSQRVLTGSALMEQRQDRRDVYLLVTSAIAKQGRNGGQPDLGDLFALRVKENRADQERVGDSFFTV